VIIHRIIDELDAMDQALGPLTADMGLAGGGLVKGQAQVALIKFGLRSRHMARLNRAEALDKQEASEFVALHDEIEGLLIDTERQAQAGGVRRLLLCSGKVYVDYLQNGHGKTIAGPFSARPVVAASCSAPLSWSEVGPKLDPKNYTIWGQVKEGQDVVHAIATVKTVNPREHDDRPVERVALKSVKIAEE
jgi:hypothetical protein